MQLLLCTVIAAAAGLLQGAAASRPGGDGTAASATQSLTAIAEKRAFAARLSHRPAAWQTEDRVILYKHDGDAPLALVVS